jgi:hypothetical protein
MRVAIFFRASSKEGVVSVIKIHAALKVEKPSEKVLPGLSAIEGAMLGGDDLYIVLLDLPNPLAKGSVARHISSMEGFDVRAVFRKVVDVDLAVGTFGRSDVSGKENPRDGVVDIDLSGGVKKVRGDGDKGKSRSDLDGGPRVGNGEKPVGVDKVHVGHEPGPESGEMDPGTRDLHPDVEAGTDVGILMGEEYPPDPGQVDKVGDAGREHRKKPRASRIEDRSVAAVNDEILVGGNPLLPGGLAEPQQNELVGSIVIENFRHRGSFPGANLCPHKFLRKKNLFLAFFGMICF